MTPWGEMLDGILKRKGMTRKAFSERIDEDQSFIGHIMRGDLQYENGPTYKPPLAKIEAWADKLRIEGSERRKFIDLAYAEHAPDHTRDLVKKLRIEVDDLRGKNRNLLALIAGDPMTEEDLRAAGADPTRAQILEADRKLSKDELLQLVGRLRLANQILLAQADQRQSGLRRDA